MKITGFVALILMLGCTLDGQAASPLPPLTVQQIVEMVFQVNPQVRAARARWQAAQHTIRQNYAPADPQFSFANLDSPTNGFTHPSTHSLQLTQALLFPGKSYFQAKTAERTAEIARLMYEATLRDVRAQAKTAFYQLQLDTALREVATARVADLHRVLEVTSVAYAANKVTQTDFIGAEFDLAAAEQDQRQLEVAQANDKTTLNQLLDRAPGEPLEVERGLTLSPLEVRLEELVVRAAQLRQEILQAALTQDNAATALTLAQLEYLPDYSITYIHNHFLIPSAAPAETFDRTHGLTFSFNLPLFFWLHQREDVQQARHSLEAAREDLRTIQVQTAAQVTTLYRQAQFSSGTAVLYRDTLVPLARQGFAVALVAYEGNKVDFVTLSGALRRSFDAQVSYLQAANQFLAQQVALEQAVGGPL